MVARYDSAKTKLPIPADSLCTTIRNTAVEGIDQGLEALTVLDPDCDAATWIVRMLVAFQQIRNATIELQSSEENGGAQ